MDIQEMLYYRFVPSYSIRSSQGLLACNS